MDEIFCFHIYILYVLDITAPRIEIFKNMQNRMRKMGLIRIILFFFYTRYVGMHVSKCIRGSTWLMVVPARPSFLVVYPNRQPLITGCSTWLHYIEERKREGMKQLWHKQSVLSIYSVKVTSSCPSDAAEQRASFVSFSIVQRPR
jgi:hypothetical protein